jgi:N4-gp56 family major capsid protein
MAVNYAEKYAAKIDERFTLGALTNGAVNNDYDWLGVETVKVFSVPTVPMNDYKLSGSNRYGDPTELPNNVQELKVEQDRAFTFTIDRKNRDDTQMTMEAGKSLQRQLDEVVIPEIDIYRLKQICEGAGQSVIGTVTKATAYGAFLDAQEKLSDEKAPQGGRLCYCTNGYYKLIKQDESFTKSGDLATQIAVNGAVGKVDGVPLIPVPSSYLPSGVNFVITNPACTAAPVKLEDYNIHDNPPGISGWLVEGRVRYDAFVLDQKKMAICVHKTAE